MSFNKFQNFIQNIDLLISILGLLFGSLITLLSIIGRVQQLIIGLFLMSVCLLHIFLRKNYIDISKIKLSSINNTYYFDLTYILLYISSILIYFLNIYSRDIIYFILIAILSTLIYLEIMNYKLNVSKIIIKIMLLVVNLQAGIYYLFPSVIGIDAYYHAKIVNYLSLVGHMPPIEYSSKYFFAPTFYIYVSSFNKILNLNTKDSLFIAIGVTSILMSLFVYLITKHFINIKAGLLSILIFNLINVNIVNDIANITPGSYILMIYFIMLYIILVKSKYYYILLPSLCIIMLFTHQLSTFVALLSFWIIYFVKKFYTSFVKLRDAIPINFYYLMFISVSIYLIWNITYVYTNISFFDFVFKPFSQILLSSIRINVNILATGKNLENVSSLDYFITQITYIVPPIMAIGGSLLWLKSKDLNKIAISITFLVIFALSYLIPLLGFNLLTDRWLPFEYLFAMPLISIYLFNIINRVNKNKIMIMCSSVFIFLLIFSSITSPVVNKVNPIIQKNVSVRNQFTLSEIVPLNYLRINYNGYITMDSDFSDCYRLYGFNATQFYEDKTIKINYFNINLLNTKNISADNNLILFRKALLNSPTEIISNDTIIYGKIDTVMYNNFKKNNLVYSDKELMLFIK